MLTRTIKIISFPLFLHKAGQVSWFLQTIPAPACILSTTQTTFIAGPLALSRGFQHIREFLKFEHKTSVIVK
jgi:hypothetical protein